MSSLLLQTAITLLLLVQGNPDIDPIVRDQAIVVANHAIQVATDQQSNTSADIQEKVTDTSSYKPVSALKAATIQSVESKAQSKGVIVSGEKAYIRGTGLAGKLTIKLGNQEPKYVYTKGTSDSYAEFVVPEWSQDAEVSMTVTNASGKTSNFYTVHIDVPKQPAVIKSIESKANPEGTVVSGEKAYIRGTGLAGKLTIKLGNQEPKYVYTVGTSDSYAEFTVPVWGYTADVSARVTNSSGQESNFYQLRIVD